MPTSTGADLARGYSISGNGKITLLRPLSPDALSGLFDRHPNQLANLQVQQIKLEMESPVKPVQRSRQSQTPNGYIFLVAWSNACLLRILMISWFRWYRKIHGYNRGFYQNTGLYRNLKDFTGREAGSAGLTSSNFPLSSSKSPLRSSNFIPAWINPKLLDRLEAQILDALRSTIANIEEGFARPTTIEYLTFLGYTQASLIEAKGDGQRMAQDGLLPRRPGSKLADLGIDLADWHQALKRSVISPAKQDLAPRDPKSPLNNKGTYGNLQEFKGAVSANPLNSSNSPLNSFKFGYPPVDNFNPAGLTYEILIELTNKTDWHLRQLVSSLEEKLNRDKQYYLIEQARLKGKVNWRK